MTKLAKSFVAINYISCSPEYIDRFEELFGSRAGAIDLMPGFHNMHVLRPAVSGEPYLILSYWENEASFKAWTGSPEFLEGHKRGFADLAAAKVAGKPAPMHSSFKTYNVISE